MKAIVVNELGGPDRLELQDGLHEPTPAPTEVVVDVEVAGVNFIDTYQREGLYPVELPFIPGQEGAGVISAIGADIDSYNVGDRVAWAQGNGSYAEKKAIDSSAIVRVPDNISMDIAASLLLQGMTAHYLVTDTFPLAGGHKCLIHAGAGGVGQLLTQLAKRAGATVVTTVSTTEKAAKSRRAGADHVVDYTETDFVEAVEDLWGKRPLDVVYDGVGAATFEGGLQLLRPRGMMVTFGNASGPVPEISPLILGRNGSLFLTRPSLRDHIASTDEMAGRAADLFNLLTSGQLQVEEPTVYPLADAARAHDDLESRRTTGKLLLRP